MALARWQRTITDDAGNVLPNASIEVRREVPGQPLATLFSDRDGLVPLGNPVNADANGFAAFHVAGGAYQITATLVEVSQVWRYVPIGTAAELDADTLISQINQNLIRKRLVEDINLYVATDGDDENNDGRTPQTPYATWQRAIDEVIGNIDVAVFHPVINVADGTYDITLIGDGALIVDEMAPFFTIRGNLASPRNVLLRTDAENSLYQQYGGEVILEGFKMEAPNDAIIKHDNGHLILGDFDTNPAVIPMVIGAAGLQIRCKKNAFLDIFGLEVDAGSSACLRADRGGTIRVQGPVARNGVPAYTEGFIQAHGGGNVLWYASSLTGAISGPSFDIQAGGMVKTYQPGDAPAVDFVAYPTLFGGDPGFLGQGGQIDGYSLPRWSGAIDIAGDDLDDIGIPGIYIGENLINSPDGGADFWTVRVTAGHFVDNFAEQIATKAEAPPYELWMRRKHADVWQPWERLGAAYSEGSWTPTLLIDGASVGVTYSRQVGRYIRHGNMVTVWGNLLLTSKGSGVGIAAIGGLPFVSSNVPGLTFVGACQMSDGVGVVDGPHIEAIAGGDTAALFANADGDSFILDDGNITDVTEISLQLTYRTG